MGDLSRHFSRYEFKCKCNKCDCDTVDHELLQLLEDIRIHFKSPVTVNSGHRCPTYNTKVGGGDNSQHLYGRAVDIVVDGILPEDTQEFVKRYYIDVSVGSYNDFTHIDTRTDGPKFW